MVTKERYSKVVLLQVAKERAQKKRKMRERRMPPVHPTEGDVLFFSDLVC